MLLTLRLFLFTEMGNTRMFKCVFHMLIYMYISGDHPKRSECEQYKVQKVFLLVSFLLCDETHWPKATKGQEGLIDL